MHKLNRPDGHTFLSFFPAVRPSVDAFPSMYAAAAVISATDAGMSLQLVALSHCTYTWGKPYNMHCGCSLSYANANVNPSLQR